MCLESIQLMSTNSSLLQAQGVSISFGGLRALHDVHLQLNHNEVVGVIGPNGAGKTTLFNAICGLVTPDSGTFSFEGKERSWPRTDQLVDLGADSTAQSGDWVIVFGDGSHGEYTADDWGSASGSINYEIVTRIGPRVPRIYSAHVY